MHTYLDTKFLDSISIYEIDMPIHTHWHMESQTYIYVLRYQHSSTYSWIHTLVPMQTHALLYTQTHKPKDTQINIHKPRATHTGTSIPTNNVFRDICLQKLMSTDLNSSTVIYPFIPYLVPDSTSNRGLILCQLHLTTHTHTPTKTGLWATSHLNPHYVRDCPPKVCSQDWHHGRCASAGGIPLPGARCILGALRCWHHGEHDLRRGICCQSWKTHGWDSFSSLLFWTLP